MSKTNSRKWIVWGVAGIYLVILLRLTVLRPGMLSHPLFSNGNINLVPFTGYIRLLQAHAYSYFVYLFGGNIFWFIPFGALLPYLTGRPRSIPGSIGAGFIFSLFIETAQYVFGTGVSELDDLILNALGAMIGFLLYRAVCRYRQRRQDKQINGGGDVR